MTAIRSFDISSANGYYAAGNVASNSSAESSDVKTFSDVFQNLETVETKKPESNPVPETNRAERKENASEVAEEAMEEEGYENVIDEEIDEVKKKEEKTVTQMLDDYIHLASEALTQIAESLGLSPEQLVAAIEKSGISPEDLLTPDGMKALFVELNDLQAPVDIILDEELHGKFKEVMNILENVTTEAETEIDFEAIKESEDFSVLMDKIETAIESAEKVNVEVPETEEVTYEFKPEETVNTEVVQTTATEQSQTFSSEQQSSANQERPMEHNEFADTNDMINPAVNGVNNGFENVVNNISEAISNQHGYVTAENIVNQITEQIKLTRGNNFSSIELTLNPESLGKVNIQVVAKDGAVTAQIVAETEMAKNAIESHIFELRNTLSEQDIKVDAVEVTIASFEFEQNAEGSQQQQEAQQARNRRRVSLDDFFADEENTETEEIVMKAEGSTVSYSV